MNRKIKLNHDYRGVLTGEVYYHKGVYTVGVNMPDDHADALVRHGRAEEVQTVSIHDNRRKGAKGEGL